MDSEDRRDRTSRWRAIAALALITWFLLVGYMVGMIVWRW